MSDAMDEEVDPDLMEEEDLPIGAEAGDEEGEEEREALEDGESEEEKIPDNPLTEEGVAESLSLLAKIGAGLAHAYVRLDIREKELTDISVLKRYIHLRYVDISRNHIKDISSFSPMSHLLTFAANQNQITGVKLEELPYLQTASFARNRIQSTEGLNHPMLETLCLSFNDISSVTGLVPSRLAHLHTLELRGNRLESTAGIILPTLRNLFLAGNIIKRLEDLDQLASLQTLHLRDNQLEALDGFSEKMVSLNYVNFRGNSISKADELAKMQCLPNLQAIVLTECPMAEDDEYRLEVLIHLPLLLRLDKDEYVVEDRSDSLDLKKKKEEDAEVARKEAELAAAEAAAAEATTTAEETATASED